MPVLHHIGPGADRFAELIGGVDKVHQMADAEVQRSLVADEISTLWSESGEWTIIEKHTWPSPLGKIGAPDVVSRYDGGYPLALARVETAFSIFDYEAQDNWKSLSDLSPVTFYIFVPSGYDEVTRRLLRIQGTSATLATYSFSGLLKPKIQASVF